MKKSTIITIVAFTLGVVILAAGFILLTDNNISKKLFSTTTTTPATTTTTRKTYEPMDLFNTTVSEYVTLGDYKNMTIETDQIEVSDEELEKRRAEMPIKKKTDITGYLKRYSAMVSSADKGAIINK